MKRINLSSIATLLTIMTIFVGCENFVEIDPPRTDLIKSTVFANDVTANAAVVDMYYQQTESSGFASGGNNSITLLSSLSSDDLINGIAWDPAYQQFNDNAILPDNSLTLSVWSDLYKCIHKANAILEGLAASTQVSEGVKHQLQGEALFMRAFCYFYLVNLFGDVPQVLVTDYAISKSMPRTSVGTVYQQIIADLTQSISFLKDNYNISNNERVRPNKGAAKALLARVYLFTDDWANAELIATELIDNTSTYSLATLDNIFLKNSTEAIWQLLPNIWKNSWDVETFNFYGHKLTPSMMNTFETGDNRKAAWVENGVSGPYDYPVKYKDYQGTGAEYSTVLRLAEAYLIRAEARTNQGKILGPNSAESDLNAIRNRAGLPNTVANNETTMLAAIEHERRVEFFAEWGHRWLDLKRWKKANDVLQPMKQTNWQVSDVLYPIPEFQILNSKVTQNPGY